MMRGANSSTTPPGRHRPRRHTATRQKLRTLGYRVTDTQSFLKLSDGEMALIDLKIVLIRKLRSARKRRGLTQRQLAHRIGSSQSRIALLERGSADVSLDLICRALIAMGLTRRQIGEAIATRRAA